MHAGQHGANRAIVGKNPSIICSNVWCSNAKAHNILLHTSAFVETANRYLHNFCSNALGFDHLASPNIVKSQSILRTSKFIDIIAEGLSAPHKFEGDEKPAHRETIHSLNGQHFRCIDSKETQRYHHKNTSKQVERDAAWKKNTLQRTSKQWRHRSAFTNYPCYSLCGVVELVFFYTFLCLAALCHSTRGIVMVRWRYHFSKKSSFWYAELSESTTAEWHDVPRMYKCECECAVCGVSATITINFVFGCVEWTACEVRSFYTRILVSTIRWLVMGLANSKCVNVGVYTQQLYISKIHRSFWRLRGMVWRRCIPWTSNIVLTKCQCVFQLVLVTQWIRFILNRIL